MKRTKKSSPAQTPAHLAYDPNLQNFLRTLANVLFLGTAHQKYGYCRVCNKELDADQYRWAVRCFETKSCSTECSRVEYKRQFACCEKAESLGCVCAHSFTCPDHGERHIGTHE